MMYFKIHRHLIRSFHVVFVVLMLLRLTKVFESLMLESEGSSSYRRRKCVFYLWSKGWEQKVLLTTKNMMMTHVFRCIDAVFTALPNICMLCCNRGTINQARSLETHTRKITGENCHFHAMQHHPWAPRTFFFLLVQNHC